MVIDNKKLAEIKENWHRPSDAVIAASYEKIKPELTAALTTILSTMQSKSASNRENFDEDLVVIAVGRLPARDFYVDKGPAEELYKALDKLTGSEVEALKYSAGAFERNVPASYPLSQAVIGQMGGEVKKLLADVKNKPQGEELEHLLQNYVTGIATKANDGMNRSVGPISSLGPINLKQFYTSVDRLADNNPDNDLEILHQLATDICPEHSAILNTPENGGEEFLKAAKAVNSQIAAKWRLFDPNNETKPETIPHISPQAALKFKEEATKIFSDRGGIRITEGDNPTISLTAESRAKLAKSLNDMLATANENKFEAGKGAKPVNVQGEIDKVRKALKSDEKPAGQGKANDVEKVKAFVHEHKKPVLHEKAGRDHSHDKPALHKRQPDNSAASIERHETGGASKKSAADSSPARGHHDKPLLHERVLDSLKHPTRWFNHDKHEAGVSATDLSARPKPDGKTMIGLSGK